MRAPLVHDAQHTADELRATSFLGHSAAEYAVGLAAHAGARRVLLYHHDPPRTDDQLDQLAARLAATSPVPVPVPVPAAVRVKPSTCPGEPVA